LGWGGGGNLALIFPQRRYRARPIKNLKVLVTHTVLLARRCNPTLVEGLELWSGDSDRAERPNEAENRSYHGRDSGCASFASG
jgi:hypothetical protein